jgi:predicted ATP-grasp superfamily ATP-dependent carboligase
MNAQSLAGVAVFAADTHPGLALRIPHSVRVRDRQPCGRTGALDALVLDAQLRQSLVCVRELGRAGQRVGALECDVEAAAFVSRWCAVSAVVPGFTQEPAVYRNALLSVLDRYPARVVIPAHDGSIEVLRTYRATLERQTALALGSEAALSIAVDKGATLAIAERLGIAVPRGVAVDTSEDVEAALAETGLPAVVKPRASWVERAGVATRLASEAVMSVDEARRAVETIVRAGGNALIQQWLPGRREAISVFSARGRIWASFAQVAHRMVPVLGGSSVLRESIALPADSTSAAQRLVRAIELEGYAEVEFRRDRDGRPVLMEINPRLSASVEIAVRAGVNFPRLLFAWAAGEPLWSVSAYRTGRRMRWLGGDYYHLKETLAHQGRPDVPPAGRAIGTFLLDFLRPAAYDYLDARDPLPALVATGQMLGHLARRVLSPPTAPLHAGEGERAEDVHPYAPTDGRAGEPADVTATSGGPGGQPAGVLADARIDARAGTSVSSEPETEGVVTVRGSGRAGQHLERPTDTYPACVALGRP